MPGPAPKPAALRQRRNKVSTKATLQTEAEASSRVVPELPELDDRGWHKMVTLWWSDIWTSPMVAEWLDADRHRLYGIAILRNDFWLDRDTSTRMKLAAEISRQEASMGLSPMDRRRLQWEIDKGEEAQEKTSKRRERKTAVETSKKDPRSVLSLVEGGTKKRRKRKA